MKKCSMKISLSLLAVILLPAASHAQGLGNGIYDLNNVLDKLFTEMLPKCERMIDVGRALAGFAALWFIGLRVWKHLAKAEPIDFFPLLRPFAIGIAIMLFPQVIALMNGVLEPTVVATRAMAGDSKKAILYNIDQQEQKILKSQPGIVQGGAGGTEKYEQPDGADQSGSLSSTFLFFNVKSYFKVLLSDLAGILYAAAALCVNTIRTFYLIVLAILGPLVLGLSIFDGFEHTLSSWFARYINIYMWLPVCNIFSAINAKILENMFTLDQDFASSTAYIILLIISIVGYTTVPTVANYIIQAGGNNTMLDKLNDGIKVAAKAAIGSI